MPLKFDSTPAVSLGMTPMVPYGIGSFTVHSDLRELAGPVNIGPPPYVFTDGAILRVLERPNDLLVTVEGTLVR
jgi:hypothetical protein